MVTDGINGNTRGSLLGIAKDARRDATECKRVELSARRFFQTAGDPALINMGWRGGHFFPVIFSGVSLGYGLAILTSADPVFCVAVCTASIMGAVMRQPVMVVGLLLICFPLKGIVCMIIAAAIAAGIPLPKPLCK